MRVLLDTHVLLWLVREPEKLSKTAVRLLAQEDVTILVSAVSVWELATKARLGKLPEAEPLLADMRKVLEDLRANPLSLTMTHASLGGSLSWDHRDPFDRMLVAQSILEQAPLVTADERIESAPGVTVIY
ncbi:MAG: type II toxin-antitoxin system VapC family toxin [Micrococcales bacterium]|nr:type II toxin-antitoxin system VapC family toxin [Micrococcales bacterium]